MKYPRIAKTNENMGSGYTSATSKYDGKAMTLEFPC